MSQAHDYNVLRWIKGELDSTLNDARHSLEELVDGGAEASVMEQCADKLHQVYGTLQMVQVYGAAMLAEEMERVARAMGEGRLAKSEEAAETLMLGVVKLPDYLDQVQAGAADVPLSLLPLMNDLRAVREEPLLSESSLFGAELDHWLQAPEEPGSPNPDLPGRAKRLRHRFHLGLLKVLRSSDPTEGLRQIEAVVSELSREAGTASLARLFSAASGLLAAAEVGALELGTAVKMLLGKLDREVKRVIDEGEAAAVGAPAVDLFKSLLYYVAQAETEDPRVQAVKKDFQLERFWTTSGAALASGELSALSQDLVDTVREAISQDLTHVKDELDLFIRTGSGDMQRLGALVEPLNKVADTLAMVGQGGLRVRLRKLSDRVAELAAGESKPSEPELMDMAGEILFVESSLYNLGGPAGSSGGASDSGSLPEGEYRSLVQATLAEAGAELSRTKEAVSSFLEHPDDLALVAEVPARFRSIAGALKVVDLSEAAGLVGGLAEYFERDILNGKTPAPDALDAVADVVTSVELFMDATAHGDAGSDAILDVARDGAARLDIGAAADTAAEAQEAGPERADASGEGGAPIPAGAETAGPGEGEGPAAEASTDEEAQALTLEVPAGEEAGGAEVSAGSEEELDAEILEIFLEEARDELEVIRVQLPRWQADPSDTEALGTFRRSFHTLKGSGRLVGAHRIGEYAWSLENLANRVIEGRVQATPEVHAVLAQSLEVLPELIEALEKGGPGRADIEALQERAFELAGGKPAGSSAPPRVPEELEEAGGEGEGADSSAESGGAPGEPASEEKPGPALELDEALAEIFTAESRTHLEALYGFLRKAEQAAVDPPVEDGVCRALHTLHGSAHMAEVEPVAVLSATLERYANELRALEHRADARFRDLLDRGTGLIESVVEAINVADAELPAWEPLVDEVEAARADLEHVSAREEEGVAGGEAKEAGPEAIEVSEVEAGVEAIETLEEGAPAATEAFAEEEQASSAEIEAPEEEAGVEGIEAPEEAPAVTEPSGAAEAGGAEIEVSEVEAGIEGIEPPDQEPSTATEPFAEGEEASPAETEAPEGEAGIEGIEPPDEEVPAATEPFAEEEASPSEIEVAAGESGIEGIEPPEEAFAAAEPSGEAASGEAPEGEAGQHLQEEGMAEEGMPADDPEAVPIEADEDLLEIFLEEARELSEAMDSAMQEWTADPGSKAPLPGLERTLHTLKGGARLAGIAPVGDLSHSFESLLTAVDQDRVRVDEGLVELAQRVADRLVNQIDEVSAFRRVRPAGDLLAELEVRTAGSTGDSLEPEELPAEPAAEPESVEESRVLQFPERAPAPAGEEPAPEESVHAVAEARQRPTQAPRPRQEQVRVRAELLDRLVNHAGEVSIYRARLEQQNGGLAFNLTELDQTVSRLRQQLRQLEIETEAQILFRYERDREEAGLEEDRDFDPLEMDRFSNIQQLSRSLAETINDLVSIRDIMQEGNRETDTLLVQQSRITTDLQDGLLRTRMVPFSTLVPRMHRLVRQTARQLGRKADLQVFGADSEMDRSILERMVAPLEHILRNAVSHGIEAPEARLEAGKEEIGRISLYLSREGNDVVITVSDDGHGLRMEAIREKAVEKGLMASGAAVSDDDLMQFIMEHGFSTSDVVTQISGRGVGLDVVVSEVKQLGGAVEIDSQKGRGSSFTIRLPLTLAITDALLVEMGDEVYAVPHTSIEGVVRAGRQEVEDCYARRRQGIEYAGHLYAVRYLGSILGTSALSLPDQAKWFPLMLVRAGEHRVALQLDALVGNRQIVVKSVGPQLSSVRWITGGTILADGRVALILDVNALVRMAAVQEVSAAEQVEPQALGEGVTVMVVDDSITVRKVTSRLLERHNMNVLTAKDGVDAVGQLQEQVPDVMLLDIEMPRMDGYELARHMRNSPDLAGVPIIMITSRTGEKHRTRAFELGVNRYLGKPYQETDLLESIYSLLAEKQS